MVGRRLLVLHNERQRTKPSYMIYDHTRTALMIDRFVKLECCNK